ncbi:transcription repressor OFP1-like [Musa acuminata AAA Group]|uniref:transcription repressor OFP1-like n=1 Tax=Musa acuminata AAA Group TaxID=214697 RepID=UPI0031D3829C
MGNYRFKLSHIISNSWFCKLKGLGRANRSHSMRHSMKKGLASASTLPPLPQPKQHHHLPNRASSYIPTIERAETPARSPVNAMASPADCHCCRHHRRRSLASVCNAESMMPEIRNSDGFHASSFVTTADSSLEVASELNLPPILTKPVKKEVLKPAPHDARVSTKHHHGTAARRSASGVHRNRIGQNSPRVESRRKMAMRQRRAVSESLVIIKSSSNPRRDFTKSMVEMIVENNLHELKDLEELLACYLSLNSKEYHEDIIKVFEHVWFALTDLRM